MKLLLSIAALANASTWVHPEVAAANRALGIEFAEPGTVYLQLVCFHHWSENDVFRAFNDKNLFSIKTKFCSKRV